MPIPPHYKNGNVKLQSVPAYCAVSRHGTFIWGTFARTQREALDLALRSGHTAITVVRCTLAIYPEPQHNQE